MESLSSSTLMVDKHGNEEQKAISVTVFWFLGHGYSLCRWIIVKYETYH